MGQHSFKSDWQGFRHIVSPERAAAALAELYGRQAAMAAAQCALEAHGDGRGGDFRFWVAVFEMLCAMSGECAEVGEAAISMDAVN